MRAVAHGLVEERLPKCPELCGGQGADPAQIDDEARRHRVRFGCDAPCAEPYYSIRCPECDGAAASGHSCQLCEEGPEPGHLYMRRCPASYVDAAVADTVRSMRWMKAGHLPEGSSIGDQSMSFLDAVAIFDQEVAAIQEAQGKD